MAESNLKLKLEAGASRVFNCLQGTRTLVERSGRPEGPETGLFFVTRRLNDIIVIKEPNGGATGMRAGPGAAQGVRTKLFVPYDVSDPYEGGSSIYTDDPGFEEALKQLIGGEGDAAQRFSSDLERLRMLEQLPSLDPFLLKDRCALAGWTIDDVYFRLSAAAWANIREHICERFATIGRFAATGGRDMSREQVQKLVDTIWEARDLEPIHPFLAALGLPTERANEMFYAWKAISYFDYEWQRSTDRLRGFSAWLQAVQPRGPAHREDRDAIEEDRGQIRTRLRGKVAEAAKIMADYNESFDTLFNKRQSAKPFAAFMTAAPTHFLTLGTSLNAIYHTLAVWSDATARVPERNSLPPAQLVRLLRTLREVS
jgi:hypothetical protein